jgi:ribosomal-protein-alanine acetyltransferase
VAFEVLGEPRTSIRHATPADISPMLALGEDVPALAHWSERSYLAAFEPSAAERIVLVAENGTQLQGFLIARLSAFDCELENIVVAAKYRRQGLGSQLLEELAEAARRRNLEQIILEVRASNRPARAFYESWRFAISGRRKCYYNHPQEDAILYSLML